MAYKTKIYISAPQGNNRNTHIFIVYNLLKNRKQHYEADKMLLQFLLPGLLTQIQNIFLVCIPNTKIICVLRSGLKPESCCLQGYFYISKLILHLSLD